MWPMGLLFNYVTYIIMEEDSGLLVNRHIKVYWPSTLLKAYLSYYTFYFYPMGVYRNHCLFVLLSVQIHVRLITFFFLLHWHTIFEHGCITMRKCVAYNIDLWSQRSNLLRFWSIRVPPGNFCLLWHCISYLAHGSITIRLCVANILDPNTTLSFDLTVKFIGFLTRLCVRPVTWIELNWIEFYLRTQHNIRIIHTNHT